MLAGGKQAISRPALLNIANATVTVRIIHLDSSVDDDVTAKQLYFIIVCTANLFPYAFISFYYTQMAHIGL